MLLRFYKLICNRYTFISLITAISVSIYFLSGGFEQKPNLKRLFVESKMVSDQPPVIFIHGVLGSKLKHKETGEEGWFSSPWKLLFDEFRHLALDVDPESLEVISNVYEPYELAGDIIGKDFYGNIIKTLVEYGGYKHAVVGQNINPEQKNLYTFIYDWRQDNVISARQLADTVDQIREDYGNPDLKVDIVAHSMGGLIARYYMRYGRKDVTNDNDFPVNMYGGERVRRVILLGTPNLGSVEMLNAFIDGIKLGLKRINPETLVTMPSLFQLLPHPLNNWIVSAAGKPLDRDLFDIETWRRFQWALFDPKVRARIESEFESRQEAEKYLATLEQFFHKTIERARRFVWSLTVPLPEDHPTLIVFGGDCHLTPARIIVEEVEGKSLIRMSPDEITQAVEGVDYEALLMEPGDHSVTKASLLGRNVLDPSVPRHKYSFFPLDHAVLLCEEHNSLTGNISFQDNLLNALLIRD
jgi:pimeloyl-ACP methyl ester carboxylesterase